MPPSHATSLMQRLSALTNDQRATLDAAMSIAWVYFGRREAETMRWDIPPDCDNQPAWKSHLISYPETLLEVLRECSAHPRDGLSGRDITLIRQAGDIVAVHLDKSN